MEHGWINDALLFAGAGATIVVGVVALWLFFDLRRYVQRRLREKSGLVIRKVHDLETLSPVQVRLKDGKTYTGLRWVGALDTDAARVAGLPHPLTNLVCFEREDGTRVWIDASAIRVIESLSEVAT